MSVIATIAVEADDFTLGGLLAAHPSIRVRLERVIPVGGALMPYLWVSNESVDHIAATLKEEDGIDAVQVIDRVNGEALVRIEWTKDVDGLVTAITETNGRILHATAEDGIWTIQLRFDEHDDLTAFYRLCVEEGITIDLQSIHNPGIPEEVGLGFGLTESQRETLLYALEEGYFNVPRRVNLIDLAADLGVSDTAVSQRLRRGISSLLEATLNESRSGKDR